MPNGNRTATSTEMLEQLIRERHAFSFRPDVNPFLAVPMPDEPREEEPVVEETDIKVLMRKRHLSKSERQLLHKPKPDYINIKDKEVCRASHVLEVDDLVDSIR
jgi:hypothetical protein